MFFSDNVLSILLSIPTEHAFNDIILILFMENKDLLHGENI